MRSFRFIRASKERIISHLDPLPFAKGEAKHGAWPMLNTYRFHLSRRSGTKAEDRRIRITVQPAKIGGWASGSDELTARRETAVP